MQLIQSWDAAIDSVAKGLSVTLQQAITNLLDNAADASLLNGSDQIRVECYLNETWVFIDIKDNGLGIGELKQQTLGSAPTLSDKKQRLGWGLFLSNASIERAGGQVHLMSQQAGGTLTRIQLPLMP
nr:ATP-binding protein [Aliikangiella sp. G2MR2-5]